MNPKSRNSKTHKTTAARALLKEPDLLDPSHDAILLWLDQEFRSLFGDESHWQWDPTELKRLRTSANKTIRQQIRELDKKIINSERRRQSTGSREASTKEAQISKQTYAASGLSPDYEDRNSQAYKSKQEKYIQFDLLTNDETVQTATALKTALQGLPTTPEPPPFPGIIIEQKEWQVPITRKLYDRQNQKKNTPPHAFIDLLTKFRRPTLTYKHYNINLATFSTDRQTFAQWQIRYTAPETICFDIRATILSIGALVREIKFLLPDIPKAARYQVVSPIIDYQELLRDQGIFFLKYEDDIETMLGKNNRWCAPTDPGPPDLGFRTENTALYDRLDWEQLESQDPFEIDFN